VGLNKSINSMLINGENIYAGTAGGVFVSTDGGSTWELKTVGIPIKPVGSLGVIGSTIVAGTNGNVYKSVNNGASWTINNDGLKDTPFTSFALNGTRTFAATSSGKIYTSTDEGVNWRQVNNNLQSGYVGSLAMIGNATFATSDNGRVSITTNNGDSWADATGDFGYWGYLLATNGTSLYAGGLGTFTSTNNGVSWTKSNDLKDWEITDLTSVSSTIYAAADNPLDTSPTGGFRAGVHVSTNNGSTWKQIYSSDYYITTVTAAGGYIYAGTGDGLFVSKDNGVTWVPNSLNYGFLESLVAKDNAVFAATVGSITQITMAQLGNFQPKVYPPEHWLIN
jgi:photosystem II stability/assembly factor-like uncharacterized protein